MLHHDYVQNWNSIVNKFQMPINIMRGMTEAQAKEMATKMAFTGAQVDEAAKSILNLYRVSCYSYQTTRFNRRAAAEGRRSTEF